MRGGKDPAGLVARGAGVQPVVPAAPADGQTLGNAGTGDSRGSTSYMHRRDREAVARQLTAKIPRDGGVSGCTTACVVKSAICPG